MGAAYKIFGKNVQPHVLAITTLATVIGGTAFALSGPKKAENPIATATPAAATAGSNSDDIDVEKLLGDLLKEESKWTGFFCLWRYYMYIYAYTEMMCTFYIPSPPIVYEFFKDKANILTIIIISRVFSEEVV